MTIDPGGQPSFRPKPTIAEIVMDCSKFTISKDYMADVLVPKARAHYPDMLPEQLEAAVRAEAIAWNEQLDGDQFWADFEAAGTRLASPRCPAPQGEAWVTERISRTAD